MRRSINLFIYGLIVTTSFILAGCDSGLLPVNPGDMESVIITADDIQVLVTQAVEQSERFGRKSVVAITDRAGNIMAVFSMNGTQGSVFDSNVGAVTKARTAAYLSSNQHGFSTCVACYITRSHFPPGAPNTPGGPLYGVPFSSVGGGDIQPNNGAPPNGAGQGQAGLTGVPGGVPIYKNGVLAGGLGVSSFGTVGALPASFLVDCGIATPLPDEAIALGALAGYAVSNDKRGDNIFIDGISLLYQIADTPPGNFTLTPADLASRGSFDQAYPSSNPILFPVEGPVDLNDGIHNYNIKSGMFLSAPEVQQIIDQAVSRAIQTRAAIRRPLNSSARTFISVVDIDGTVLDIWRMADATIFSFDVSVQKARTVVAFSDPGNSLGTQIRQVLNMPSDQQMAVTTRAIGFLAQRYFPPGIDQAAGGNNLQSGPLFVPDPILPLNDFRWQQNIALSPFGNGITIFPGGIPLYKNGRLVGGIGVSGDGVDQDDYIAAAGATGFDAPANTRCDQFVYQNVRLPYVKFPRNPDVN